MATLIDYKGLKVLTPDPTGGGGLAIQNDLKLLADRLAASQYVDHCRLSFVNTATVTVGTGNALSGNGEMNIDVQSPLTARITSNGANGLDNGAVAPGTIYYVHVIADASDNPLPVASLISLNTSPSLPAGYTHFRRIGFLATDSAGDIVRFQQVWNGLTRRYYFAENRDRLQVLTAGRATTFTTVDLNSLVPATAQSVMLSAAFTNNAPTGQPSDRMALLRSDGDVHDGTLHTITNGIGSSFPLTEKVSLPCSSQQRIQYRVSNNAAELTLAIEGLEDEL